MSDLKKKQKVYYARIIESSGIYDVLELIIRTVQDNWFVGIEKRDKHAYLFSDDAINKTIFINRNNALTIVQEAESRNKKNKNEEIYYEEY